MSLTLKPWAEDGEPLMAFKADRWTVSIMSVCCGATIFVPSIALLDREATFFTWQCFACNAVVTQGPRRDALGVTTLDDSLILWLDSFIDPLSAALLASELVDDLLKLSQGSKIEFVRRHTSVASHKLVEA